MNFQSFGTQQVEGKTDPRKAVRELVRDSILIEQAMSAPALALYLMRIGDPETIAALARELTTEYLVRTIRAERILAATPPDSDWDGEPESGKRNQPFLPEYVEQLKQLPEVIPNQAGEPIKTLKAKYADLRDHLNVLNRQYWARRASDPEIVATKALLHVMHPQWKENPEVTLEEALILGSQPKGSGSA